jgi:hypothetical protein
MALLALPPTAACTSLQVAWYLKCRAITLKAWLDDTDLEEEVCLSAASCSISNLQQPSVTPNQHLLAAFWNAIISAARTFRLNSSTSWLLLVLQAIGDALMDEHVAQTARPGTSLARPATSTAVSTSPASQLHVNQSTSQCYICSNEIHRECHTCRLVSLCSLRPAHVQAAVVRLEHLTHSRSTWQTLG